MLRLTIDKAALSVAPLDADSEDRRYWLTRPPLERLEAIEFLRQTSFGYDPATSRLQRVLEIAQLARD
jgi:hypothetical protein